MKKPHLILGLSGLGIMIFGLYLAFVQKTVPWYSYFVLGGTFFLAWINEILDNDSLFRERVHDVVHRYFLYLMATLIIELVGRGLLGLWDYPQLNLVEEVIHVFLITYSFAFFFIYETFKLVTEFISNFDMAVIITTLLNAFIHEIPNTHALEWIYDIPYIDFQLFQINIVVVIGWVILVAVPLIVEDILDENKHLFH